MPSDSELYQYDSDDDPKPKEEATVPGILEEADGASGAEGSQEATGAPDGEEKTAESQKEPLTASESPGEEPVRHKVVIDGAEELKTIDELIRGYQLERASYKKMQEAAEVRKDAEYVLKSFVGDPIGLAEKQLRKAGYSEDQIRQYLTSKAEQFLAPVVEELTMSPEERTLAQKKRELERIQQEIQQAQGLKEAQDNERKQAILWKKTLGEIDEALDTAKLEKTDENCIEVGRILAESWEAEIDLTPKEAVAIVKRELAKRLAADEAKQRDKNKALAQQALSTKTGKAASNQTGGSTTKPPKRGVIRTGTFDELMNAE